MNTQEQKKLSESLLAACKAAGVEEPKYIAQDLSGAVWHYKDEPDTNNYGAIWATFTAQNKKLDHPPYATDWQDSLLEFRDYALIRTCDKCKAITAIDMIGSEQNEREMQYKGETVSRVTKEEARRQVDKLAKCNCGARLFVGEFGGNGKPIEIKELGMPLADFLARHPDHIAEPSKMIEEVDSCDIGYNQMMRDTERHDSFVGYLTSEQIYQRAWSDALTWWDSSEQPSEPDQFSNQVDNVLEKVGDILENKIAIIPVEATCQRWLEALAEAGCSVRTTKIVTGSIAISDTVAVKAMFSGTRDVQKEALTFLRGKKIASVEIAGELEHDGVKGKFRLSGNGVFTLPSEPPEELLAAIRNACKPLVNMGVKRKQP